MSDDNTLAKRTEENVFRYYKTIGKVLEETNTREHANIMDLLITLELLKQTLMDMFILKNPHLWRNKVEEDIDEMADIFHRNIKIDQT